MKRRALELTVTSLCSERSSSAVEEASGFQRQPGRSGGQNVVFKEYFHIGLGGGYRSGFARSGDPRRRQKSLLQLSKEVQELAEKARDRKLGLEEMKGGTFTISNQGGIGGGHFTPIINRPEVAILGLGRSA